MSAVTTHILDISRGRPAAGVGVVLERGLRAGEWQLVGRGETDADGRLNTLMPQGGSAPPGVYRLRFETRAYFDTQDIPSFYPYVEVTFEITDEAHHHVPLLLSPFGYSTYRGT